MPGHCGVERKGISDVSAKEVSISPMPGLDPATDNAATKN